MVEQFHQKPPEKDLAEDWFETILLELLYELDELGEISTFDIDSTSQSSTDRDYLAAAARINELARALGIDPARWTDSLPPEQRARFTKRRLIAIKANGTDLGDFFTSTAFSAIPIESQDEGRYNEGSIQLTIAQGKLLELSYTSTLDEVGVESDTFDIKYTGRVIAQQ